VTRLPPAPLPVRGLYAPPHRLFDASPGGLTQQQMYSAAPCTVVSAPRMFLCAQWGQLPDTIVRRMLCTSVIKMSRGCIAYGRQTFRDACAVGIEADDGKIDQMISSMEGKSLDEIIAAGNR